MINRQHLCIEGIELGTQPLALTLDLGDSDFHRHKSVDHAFYLQFETGLCLFDSSCVVLYAVFQ